MHLSILETDVRLNITGRKLTVHKNAIVGVKNRILRMLWGVIYFRSTTSKQNSQKSDSNWRSPLAPLSATQLLLTKLCKIQSNEPVSKLPLTEHLTQQLTFLVTKLISEYFFMKLVMFLNVLDFFFLNEYQVQLLRNLFTSMMQIVIVVFVIHTINFNVISGEVI